MLVTASSRLMAGFIINAYLSPCIIRVVFCCREELKRDPTWKNCRDVGISLKVNELIFVGHTWYRAVIEEVNKVR